MPISPDQYKQLEHILAAVNQGLAFWEHSPVGMSMETVYAGMGGYIAALPRRNLIFADTVQAIREAASTPPDPSELPAGLVQIEAYEEVFQAYEQSKVDLEEKQTLLDGCYAEIRDLRTEIRGLREARGGGRMLVTDTLSGFEESFND